MAPRQLMDLGSKFIRRDVQLAPKRLGPKLPPRELLVLRGLLRDHLPAAPPRHTAPRRDRAMRQAFKGIVTREQASDLFWDAQRGREKAAA